MIMVLMEPVKEPALGLRPINAAANYMQPAMRSLLRLRLGLLVAQVKFMHRQLPTSVAPLIWQPGFC